MMKLKLTIETIRANLSRDCQTQQLENDRLVIGRSPSADIRIDGRLVGLIHAVFVEQESQIWIEDQGALGGSLFNGAPFTRKPLQKNDQITIGDFVFTVQAAKPEFELHLLIDESKTVDLKSKIQADLKRVDSVYRLRWVHPISYLAVALTAVVFIAWPKTQASKILWSPGEISSAHRTLKNSCSSCHGDDFSKVDDAACLECHALSEHVPRQLIESGKSEAEPSCMSCHSEHRGPEGHTLQTSEACAYCHQIDSFEVHPEFTKRTDQSQLKFNHAAHLGGEIPSGKSTRKLACTDCHQTTANRETMVPISFKEHCQSCHGLQFDENFADLEVPHARANEVFAFLLKTYQSKGVSQSQPFRSREIPGRPLKSPPNLSPLEATREKEEFLFEQGACQLCHQIEKQSSASATESRYHVSDVSFESSKLLTKYPIHSTHESFACIDCHSQATQSQEASDQLHPQLKDCQSCHKSQESREFVRSECSLCHGFHQSIKLP